ncbi:hypothetical protein P9A14_10165 [Gordonia hongkongensis]|uniref:Uncharacterized protein n=1 Tax=Gordonia hongkongensis TaxID=1701090 RepID=A0AAX3TE26_9ACTN|nr:MULTISPECIES: hypothetical protein [Gordonia]QIK45795.1 hypothetical protein G8C36_14575 [Gordonia terrae]MBN0975225.1 hypothetical protein [Gordonia sp. BP-119]MBN0985386.1 hypothetical protein [Gordonia sp. BP-94]MDF6100685.1 hypothetical protein [Gordonia hongkongensis]MDT0220702.1 hypothetical protein [Gordonia sp. AC31]
MTKVGLLVWTREGDARLVSTGEPLSGQALVPDAYWELGATVAAGLMW